MKGVYGPILLHYAHAEKGSNAKLSVAIDLHIPQQHYGEETQNPIADGADNAVDDSGKGDNDRIYASTLGPLDLFPEVRRREALDHHGDEEPDRNQPGDDKHSVYRPPMPCLDRESEEKYGNRSANTCRHWRIEDLAEIPCSQGYLGTIKGEFFRVLSSAAQGDAM